MDNMRKYIPHPKIIRIIIGQKAKIGVYRQSCSGYVFLKHAVFGTITRQRISSKNSLHLLMNRTQRREVYLVKKVLELVERI